MHCPTCGSSVPADATICPNCGDELPIPDKAIPVISAPVIQPAPAPEATAQISKRGSTDTKVCSECGAANRASDNFCSTCGEPLTAMQADPVKKRAAVQLSSKTSATRQYLFAGIAVLAIAALVYLLAAPKEHTGPPVEEPTAGSAQQEGALPPGHPPMGARATTAEQEKMIQDLKATLAKNPGDTAAQLRLANVLYDAGRYSDAIAGYREYLKRHPGNGDARTDMAYSLYQAGDVDGSMTELKRVLALDNRHQTAALNLSMMYVEKLSRGISESRLSEDSATTGKTAAKPSSGQHFQDSLRMLSYRDSLFLWLNRVVAIDSTTPQGQRATQILAALKDAHNGTMAP